MRRSREAEEDQRLLVTPMTGTDVESWLYNEIIRAAMR